MKRRLLNLLTALSLLLCVAVVALKDETGSLLIPEGRTGVLFAVGNK
ncbi:MAG TPA: hypothetical protein VFB66_27235 [Tepidisphaeraceae bacterium]|nr:hypothetical protein [Tepidisphaeraceae bacterium]